MKIEVEVVTIEDKQLKLIEFNGEVYTVSKARKEPIPRKAEKVKRRYRYLRPKNAVGRDKTYMTWITQPEIDACKRAIRTVEYAYVPTTQAITKKTGYTIQRTRAILHYMKAKGMITQKRQADRKVVNRLIK